MAIIQVAVANPTMADVTVNGKTAAANHLTKLGLDDTTNEAYQFMAAGCALASTTGATFQQREQGGYILERDEATI